MTTIVSNGYYLIADHRRCKEEYSKARKHVSLKTNVRTGLLKFSLEKATYIHRDIAEKIILLPVPIDTKTSNGGKVVAIAFAGSSETAENYVEFIDQWLEDKDVTVKSLRALIPYLKRVEFVKPVKMLCVTDTHHTLEILFDVAHTDHGRHVFTKLKTRPPGEIAGIGSGFTKIKLLSLPVDKLSPRELFLIAQYLDPYTSGSYGVLGLKENKYFPFVWEKRTDINAEAKALILQHLRPNYNNGYIPLAVSGEEDYDL